MPEPDPDTGVDPDLAPDDTDSGAGRPAHLRPEFVLLVGLGGAAGTLSRALLTDLAGGRTGAATLIINVVGAFLLGTLLELLARLGPDRGARRLFRLGVGTGFLGGFTTYSTLALVVAQSLRAGHGLEAVGYGLASLLLGLAAVVAGFALARRRPHYADEGAASETRGQR